MRKCRLNIYRVYIAFDGRVLAEKEGDISRGSEVRRRISSFDGGGGIRR